MEANDHLTRFGIECREGPFLWYDHIGSRHASLCRFSVRKKVLLIQTYTERLRHMRCELDKFLPCARPLASACTIDFCVPTSI